MSKHKTTSSEKKQLELRQLRADAKKAEYEAEQEEMRTERQRRQFREEHEYSPSSRGVFHFNAPVDSATVALFTNAVQRYAHLNPGGSITIYIYSPGGSVLAGLALYDSLRTLSSQGHHITTVVRGYAASFGAVLLQAGDTRLMGEESYIMLHEISSVALGKLHEIENEAEFCGRLNARMFDIIANRTDGKWTGKRLYAKARAKDWWIGAQESVTHGFADAVG